MNRPRPVPPYLAVVWASAWANGRNRWARQSVGDAHAGVLHDQLEVLLAAATTDGFDVDLHLPRLVNLTALLTRLCRICPSLEREGHQGAHVVRHGGPRASLLRAATGYAGAPPVDDGMDRGWPESAGASSPDLGEVEPSIADFLQRLARFTGTRRVDRWSTSSAVRSISSSSPSKPPIGVRISWLMVARKWTRPVRTFCVVACQCKLCRPLLQLWMSSMELFERSNRQVRPTRKSAEPSGSNAGVKD